MYKGVILSLIVFFTCPPSSAQILPKEGSNLNYRIIGFSFPSKNNADNYRVEIASGNYDNDDTFKKNVVTTSDGTGNKIIAEVPSFGMEYTWRVVTSTPTKTTGSQLHHFRTMMSKNVDSTLTRLRIIKEAEKYKDSYVFLDGSKVLYDMKGRPVWFLPQIDSLDIENIDVRDLNLTRQGTMTFIAPERIYEVNYDGTILWRGPANGVGELAGNKRYHHEFKRLGNGHYMVEGMEIKDMLLKKANETDSGLYIFEDPAKYPGDVGAAHHPVLLATLLEYDARGNLVWTYHSSKYFAGSCFWLETAPGGMPDLDIHDNGFYFDEQAKMIYLSFRDLSQVVKIKYPEGTVVSTYGNVYKPGAPRPENRLFCHQHCPRISEKGYLYLFNNNVCHADAPPGIVMMEQPVTDKDQLKEVWKYDCTKENKDSSISGLDFFSGGSVEELTDGSILADMGTYYSKVFIVGLDKKELWSAIPEARDTVLKTWKILPQYRASIIPDHRGLEQLIWNVETGNK